MLTLSLIVAINISLGLIIFLRNTSSSVNRLFLVLAISTSAWVASSYLTDHAALDQRLLWGKLAFAFPVVATLCLALLSRSFPMRVTKSKKELWLIYGLAALAILISLSDLVVKGIHIREDGGTDLTPGILYFGFILLELSLFSYALRNYVWGRKKFNRQQKSQASLVATGFMLTFIWALLCNVLLPLVDFGAASKLGPAGTVIFVSFTAYAIVRHKLFNIKLIIARSMAYVLLIATCIGIYTLIVFLAAKWVVNEDSVIANQIIPIVVALFIAATAPYFKRLFDRVTNKFFYRDAYDPQIFLDELNRTLVGNIEIGILLRHTATVIEQNLKAECHIYVKETETTPSRIMGTTKMELKAGVFKLICDELATIQAKTVATDTLEDHYTDLRKALEDNNIAIVSSLITSYAANKEATAYLLLSPKKSGNAYSKQDLRIINIITDELLIAIQNALRFEEIQSFNITLQNRINDATAKLKRSNEKLKEMDETKDEFISMASHQLRTPLTSVKGYLSMVLDGDAGKVTDTQQQLLNQAYVSSQRMVYLIADLLNVSRLKTGKFVIDAAPTNLADMVESEIAQLTQVAKSRKLTLSFNKPENFPELMLDETKTRQVVMNFVDNAIYYTPSGGKIKIELQTDRSSVYFMVKDNGLGVPKAEQAHMFTKFYRAKNAQKARPDGTGLGLFMAKKVITDQGGTILFESTENKGSTFGFKFDLPANEKSAADAKA